MDHWVINQNCWMNSNCTITLKPFRKLGIRNAWKFVPNANELKPPYCKTHVFRAKKMLVSVIYDKKLYEEYKDQLILYSDDDMTGNPQSDAPNRRQQDLPKKDGTPGSVAKPIPLANVDLSQCCSEKSLVKICRNIKSAKDVAKYK